MLDLHCHIIFDVDDGSKDLDMSMSMLRAARQVGIDKIVATPHCRWDSFDRDKIEQNFDILADRADVLGIDMYLGYEVNWKKIVDLGLDECATMHIEDTDIFLLEFSDDSLPPRWQGLITKIQDRGLRVVIAHPERYAPVQRNLDIAYEMKDLGCYLQLSANFIDEGRFDARRKTATTLLREGLVDYIASDAHRPEHYKLYAQAMEFARKM